MPLAVSSEELDSEVLGSHGLPSRVQTSADVSGHLLAPMRRLRESGAALLAGALSAVRLISL
jgi:hypothetical protein